MPSTGNARHGAASRLAPRGVERRFRYVDARGRQITDAAQLERIDALAIPPAWKDVWISPSPRAKLQATGRRRGGAEAVPVPPDFRAEQEQAKYDKLIRFAERLPDLRAAMAEHMDADGLDRERRRGARAAADQPRLVPRRNRALRGDRGRSGSRRCGSATSPFAGIAIVLRFRGKHKIHGRRAFVDAELAAAVRELRADAGRARSSGTSGTGRSNLDEPQLNDYIGRISATSSPRRTSGRGAAR